MYGTVIQLTMTPEQLGQLFDERLAKALASFTPPTAEESTLPEMLTRKQASEYLQVSYTTLNDWAKDTHERPAVLVPWKINGRVLYPRAAVISALKESRRFKSTDKAGKETDHA